MIAPARIAGFSVSLPMSEAKPAASDAAIAAFISKWSKVRATEKSVSQSFLLELCDLLGVERPAGADDYKFEKEVSFAQPRGKPTTKFIDLYKRGSFVLEAKKATPSARRPSPESRTNSPARRKAMSPKSSRPSSPSVAPAPAIRRGRSSDSRFTGRPAMETRIAPHEQRNHPV